MTLTLTVSSYRGERPVRVITANFGPNGGTIGRGSDCTWILPDQYEVVSRRHCRISWASGCYWITDTASKNGLSINDGPKLDRNVPVALTAGDSLAIGDYLIDVRVDQQDEQGPMPPVRDRPQQPIGFGSYFGGPPPDLYPAPGPAQAGGFIEPLFGGAPPSSARSSSAFSSSPLAPSHDAGADWLASPEPDIAPIAQQVVHMASPVAGSPPRVADLPLNWNPFVDDAPDLPPPPAARTRPTAPTPTPRPAAGQPIGAARLLEAFLDGAGLPPESFAGADPESTLRTVGRRFRALAAGLRELMIAGLSPANPLKTSADEDQAILALLFQRGRALDGDQAIAEAFKDIKQHEFALLAGARSAIAEALEHFDPATLSQRLAKGNQGALAALLPMARRAKYWELFKSEFRRVADEAEEDAHGPLARALARAYEEQKKNC
jgi:type VI secretion system FHA domain protein